HPNGPCDREQRCEGPVVRRETGSGVEQGDNHRDDADREHPHGGEARSEELHPGSDDQEAAGREDLEEVAIEYLATEDPRGAVEKDAFIAEPDDVAKDGGADRARDQRDGVEQRIAEEWRTCAGFGAGTSAHGVSMQGRSHRRFPFPTQSTFAPAECEVFLGGGPQPKDVERACAPSGGWRHRPAPRSSRALVAQSPAVLTGGRW